MTLKAFKLSYPKIYLLFADSRFNNKKYPPFKRILCFLESKNYSLVTNTVAKEKHRELFFPVLITPDGHVELFTNYQKRTIEACEEFLLEKALNHLSLWGS